MRLLFILAVVAFALAGCNVNQAPNASTQTASGTISPDSNPIHYAQTSGFYAGR